MQIKPHTEKKRASKATGTRAQAQASNKVSRERAQQLTTAADDKGGVIQKLEARVAELQAKINDLKESLPGKPQGDRVPTTAQP